MTDIPIDRDESASGERRTSTVEVEREITKRAVIQAVTSVVMVLLYMAYAFIRDREPGVVSLDGAADDWD